MTIDELYRKLLRIGRRANYRPEELRNKFLDALPIPWLEKAEDIGEHLPLDELAKKLYEIELRRIARHKRDRISDPLRLIKTEEWLDMALNAGKVLAERCSQLTETKIEE
ncbi:4932_t:CDS:2 [Cetraspora pellucida]|uniref:4932_t:CDS:1 n=1 Tax=Cetraspora pellucida TaxID=1433469 RepID=A0ACA9P522_9GLOM|nr:4932_t:CDS:2 [Cetraspora pellucida]